MAYHGRGLKDDGSIRSLKGRKCRFDMFEPLGYELKKALPKKEARRNTATQRHWACIHLQSFETFDTSVVADMTKQAMVDLYEAGERPLLQVCLTGVQCSRSGTRKDPRGHGRRLLQVPNKCDIDLGLAGGEAVEV